MAGQPYLAGHRITVLTIVTAVEDFGGIDEVAHQLRIDPGDVREALEWAREHPEEMDELREEWDELQSATADREDWEGSTPDDTGEALFGDFDEGVTDDRAHPGEIAKITGGDVDEIRAAFAAVRILRPRRWTRSDALVVGFISIYWLLSGSGAYD